MIACDVTNRIVKNLRELLMLFFIPHNAWEEFGSDEELPAAEAAYKSFISNDLDLLVREFDLCLFPMTSLNLISSTAVPRKSLEDFKLRLKHLQRFLSSHTVLQELYRSHVP